jgi:hypothetical protein
VENGIADEEVKYHDEPLPCDRKNIFELNILLVREDEFDRYCQGGACGHRIVHQQNDGLMAVSWLGEFPPELFRICAHMLH